MDKKNRAKSPILSAEALASQLNSSLPINVMAEELEKNPEMSVLLEDLTHRLTPTGMCKETHALLVNAKHTKQHSRKKYLEEATFYRLTQDVLYKNSTDVEQESLKEMREALTLSELQDHLILLDCGSSSGSSCDDLYKSNLENPGLKEKYAFGITPELIVARSKACVSDKCIQDTATAIEVHLRNEWTKIASFYDPVGFLSYHSDEFVKIPEILEQKSHAVAAEKKKLAHSIMQNNYLLLQTQEQLLEYGTFLKSLMVKQRLCQYPAIHRESQVARISAMLLKLKYYELEILLNTYTSKSIPALKLLRSHIQERTAKAEKSLARLNHELSSFNGLDSKFKELLVDYAKIQADIEMFKASAKKS